MTDLLPGISLRHVDTARVRTGVLVDDRTEGEVVVLVHGNVSSSIFWQETMWLILMTILSPTFGHAGLDLCSNPTT